MTDELPNLPQGRIGELARSNADKAPQVARAHAKPYWRDPARWVRDLCLLALAAFALLGYFNSLSKPDTHDLRNQVSALQQQIVGLGATPVVGSAGAQGQRGPRGPAPSDAEVQADIRAVCSVTPSYCQQPVSLAKLQAAVSACFAAKQCPAPPRGSRGPSGPAGASGASGASGAVGATGPGPTPQQIADGWASWCSSHSCVGPTGPAGPKGDPGDRGAKGDTGRGIASIDCAGLGVDQLVIHYDDGTDQTVPCNPPTPTPSGAPSS